MTLGEGRARGAPPGRSAAAGVVGPANGAKSVPSANWGKDSERAVDSLPARQLLPVENQIRQRWRTGCAA